MKNYRFLMTMFALAALTLTSCNKKQVATTSSADADSTTVVAPTEKALTDKLTTKKIAKSLKNDAGELKEVTPRLSTLSANTSASRLALPMAVARTSRCRDHTAEIWPTARKWQPTIST